jgi:hypothetical protein
MAGPSMKDPQRAVALPYDPEMTMRNASSPRAGAQPPRRSLRSPSRIESRSGDRDWRRCSGSSRSTARFRSPRSWRSSRSWPICTVPIASCKAAADDQRRSHRCSRGVAGSAGGVCGVRAGSAPACPPRRGERSAQGSRPAGAMAPGVGGPAGAPAADAQRLRIRLLALLEETGNLAEMLRKEQASRPVQLRRSVPTGTPGRPAGGRPGYGPAWARPIASAFSPRSASSPA